ncbi:hypothetical protein NQ317_003016 [Molorchus minor]|uniref:CCHC-type domain-containing protein n=1 Tax=Molorchus minor TaxID=1323400 RepID=A0ABQ9IU22_9CUCU|nr:hypothetical protein NQ317_003016 [Molorchus minor]
MIVKKEGSSYADLLKDVRGKVRSGTLAARAIKTIRETKDGEMLIVMDSKEEESIKELTKQIREDKVVKTLGRDGDKTVTIKDLDSVSTKKEIEMAIAHLLGIKEEEVTVGPPKTLLRGQPSDHPNHAVELVNKGTVRIGLNQCPIDEFVKVLQCFRCLKYGHRRDECKEGTDRSAECLRCGGNGHKAKECERTEHCVLCQKRWA